MKKLLLLIAAVASFASCVQNIEGVDTSLGYTTITVGMPESRTSLGAKDDNGIYAIYWSEGDQIVVNGAASTRMDIGENRKSATFHFEGSLLKPPFYLTYPYTKNSACAEGKPTVVFAAEQEYVEGSFGVGYAPMCGYIESGEASMQHLAGVLQFTVKGTNKLSKIEIIAEEGKALAGEFDVNCESGTLTAINGEVSNKITYTANQTLTADGTAFHITVPKGIEGVCKVVLTDSTGQKMNLKWTASNVSAGVVREFTPFTFKGGASFELQEMTSITDEMEVEEREEPTSGVWGYIKYDDGTPAENVSVSDGFSVVRTDALGLYHFADGVDKRTYYIYYSIPATAKVVVNDDGYHTFFKRYSSGIARYDFTLERIEKESAFSLFAIADTHGARESYVERIEAECVPGIKAEKQKRGTTPCYAVILGDIVCCSAREADTSEANQQQKSYYMPLMREMFAPENTGGVPTFYVMGNHDHERAHFDNASTNYGSDLESFNFYAQRAFEEMFAPADYSFNRGDVHIVCMRNSQWKQNALTNNTSNGNYNYGDFTADQVEWLRQDLANVDKDKMIIFCVHIPLRNGSAYQGNQDVVALLKQYSKVKILSGHIHYNRSTTTSEWHGIDEVSIVGNWGYIHGRCSGDGTPYGFDVYDFSGSSIAKNYFRACSSSHGGEGYQMRAYLSDMLSGKDATSTANTGWYGSGFFSYSSILEFKPVYINIFNGNAAWTVKLNIYHNNTLVNTLEVMYGGESINGTWGTNGEGTKENPYCPTSSSDTRDWWAAGGFANSKAKALLTTAESCYHMFACAIPFEDFAYIEDGTGSFEIEATDPYGTTHRCTKLFDANDIADYLIYEW